MPSAFSVAAERLAPDEAVAPRTATVPEIDGDLSDPVWQTAPRVENFFDPQSGGVPFRTTRMQALHDDRYLYLAVWCAEPRPDQLKAVGKTDDGVWEDDCLEVFIGHTHEPCRHHRRRTPKGAGTRPQETIGSLFFSLWEKPYQW